VGNTRAGSELGDNAESLLAASEAVANRWLEALEESGNGLPDSCGPDLLRALVADALAGRPPGPHLRRLTSSASCAQLASAARALHKALEAVADDRPLAGRLRRLASRLKRAGGESDDEQTFRRAVRALQEATTSPGVLRALLSAARRLTGARAALWWEREAGGWMSVTATAGAALPTQARRLRVGAPFWRAPGESAAGGWLELSPDRPEHRAYLSQTGASAALLVRAHLRRRWIGALAVHDGRVDGRRATLLASLVQQAALARQTLDLTEQTRQLVRSQRHSISELGLALGSVLNLDELVEVVRRVAQSVPGADAAQVLLADESGQLSPRGRPEAAAEVDQAALVAFANHIRSQPEGRAVWEATGRSSAPGVPDLRRRGFREVFGVPIRLREHVIGALVVLSRDPDSLGPFPRQMIETFASEAAVAIENLSLVEGMQRRLLEMADLTWVSTRVAATLDSSQIARTVADAAAKALSAPIAAIYLARPEGGWALAPGGWLGFDGEAAPPLPPEGHLGADALASGAPRVVADVLEEGRQEDALVRTLGARSLLCVPMLAQQGLQGLLAVADSEPRAFPTHNIALLSAYGNQAALALQSALLYQNVVRHLNQISRLFEISRSLASSLDLSETLEMVLRSASELLAAPACILMLAEGESGELVTKAVHGLKPDPALYEPLKPGEGLAGLAAQTGEALVSSDVSRDGRFSRRARAREEGLRAGIAAPLIARGRTVGVINVYRRSEDKFTDDDKDLLVSLANSAAVAIENANLYAEAQERSEFLAAMTTEINQRMRNTLQAAAGLLRMELDRPTPRSASDAITRAVARLHAMATVHDLLRSREVHFVDIKEAARRVVEIVRHTTAAPPSIEIRVDGARVMLPSQKATGAVLVIGELLDNAIRHGLLPAGGGRVCVSLAESAGQVVIQVRDNGVGLPPRFDLDRCADVGLKVVRAIIEQDLGGVLTLQPRDGLCVLARFAKH